jgi:hypothetical protein
MARNVITGQRRQAIGKRQAVIDHESIAAIFHYKLPRCGLAGMGNR